jgi:hypothetical protein
MQFRFFLQILASLWIFFWNPIKLLLVKPQLFISIKGLSRPPFIGPFLCCPEDARLKATRAGDSAFRER